MNNTTVAPPCETSSKQNLKKEDFRGLIRKAFYCSIFIQMLLHLNLSLACEHSRSQYFPSLLLERLIMRAIETGILSPDQRTISTIWILMNQVEFLSNTLYSEQAGASSQNCDILRGMEICVFQDVSTSEHQVLDLLQFNLEEKSKVRTNMPSCRKFTFNFLYVCAVQFVHKISCVIKITGLSSSQFSKSSNCNAIVTEDCSTCYQLADSLVLL